MGLVGILTAALIALGAIELRRHARNARAIPTRILVNGTRGKTSVTRLMAAALREAGIATYAKCTGTAAAVIDVSGQEAPLVRRRGARLTEQIPLFRRAAKDGARAIVVECMAVRPESQKIMAQLVMPTMVLLTNARVDHVAEIGATEAETLGVLALSIPKGATVVSGEAGLDAYRFDPIPPDDGALAEDYLASFDHPVFEDNIRLVLAACAALNVDRETAMRGMAKARPDIGMAGPFFVNDCVVVNAFAANDVKSTEALLQKIERERGLENAPITIVFNNRADREYRLGAFLPLIRALAPRTTRLIAIGDGAGKVARYYLRRAGVSAAAGEAESALNDPGIVLMMGNIKGAGGEFVERLMREGRNGQCSR